MTATDMAGRPNLAAAMDHYDEMLTQLRDRLAGEFGGKWIQRKAKATASQPIRGVPGPTRVGWSALWVLDATLAADDASKRRALAIITEVATSYGFTKPVVYVDRAGELQLVADDPFGCLLRIGSAENTSLSYQTGVHPAA